MEIEVSDTLTVIAFGSVELDRKRKVPTGSVASFTSEIRQHKQPQNKEKKE